MKQTILIAAIALGSLASCKKKYCYECKVTVTQRYTGAGIPPSTGSSSTVVCNQTADGIKDVEKAGTSVVSGSSGGVTYEQRTTTVCTRQ